MYSAFPDAGPAAFPGDAVARLSEKDLVLIESFFARALELPLATRTTMAERILQGMVVHMGVPFPEGSPERSLEALALQLRSQRRSPQR